MTTLNIKKLISFDVGIKNMAYCIFDIDLSNNLKDKVFVYTIEDYLRSIVDRSEEFKTYEEAELACLKKLIEIVENK